MIFVNDGRKIFTLSDIVKTKKKCNKGTCRYETCENKTQIMYLNCTKND